MKEEQRSDNLPWMDDHSLAALDWKWLWGNIQPQSVLGKAYKHQLTPFVKGEEQAWSTEIGLSQRLDQHRFAEHVSLDTLYQALQSIPDPRSFLDLLSRGEGGAQADWFMLKQFIYHAKTILKGLLFIAPSLEELYQRCVKCYAFLGQEEQGLSISSLTPTLWQWQQEYSRLHQQVLHKRRKRRKELERELKLAGGSVHRDGVIYIPASDQSTIIDCSRHPELELVQQNPFEAVFLIKQGAEESKLVKALEQLQLNIQQGERETLETLAQQFRPYLLDLKQAAQEIGVWDFRLAKWKLKEHYALEWPSLGLDDIKVEQGRYLPLEWRLKAQGRSYSPINVQIEKGCTVFTGLNMGGKSVALKTIGLLCSMAHYALPVPASFFETPLFNGLQLISGDQQNVEQGLSTFGAEMERLAAGWESKDQLVLIDELARGTNPTEGEALVFAVTQQFAERKDQTVISVTHFTFKAPLDNVCFYQIGHLDETGQISFEVTKVQQKEAPRQALLVAQKMGVPAPIIERAWGYLHTHSKI